MKKFREDSLDDFDIDGKIAADRASQPELVKKFMNAMQHRFYSMVCYAVGGVLERHGLSQVKYSRDNGYRIFTNNSFGGTYKPGQIFTFQIDIGDYNYVKWDDGNTYYNGELSRYDYEKIEKGQSIVAMKGSGFWPNLRNEVNEAIYDGLEHYAFPEIFGLNDLEQFYKPMEKGTFDGTLHRGTVGGINSSSWFSIHIKCPEITPELMVTYFNEGKTMNVKEKARKLLEAIDEFYNDDEMTYDGATMQDADYLIPNDEKTNEDLQDEYMDFVSDEGAFANKGFIDDDEYPNLERERVEAGFNASLDDMEPNLGNVSMAGEIFNDEVDDGYAEIVDDYPFDDDNDL